MKSDNQFRCGIKDFSKFHRTSMSYEKLKSPPLSMRDVDLKPIKPLYHTGPKIFLTTAIM